CLLLHHTPNSTLFPTRRSSDLNDTIEDFITQFTENYTDTTISDDVVGFYNDAFMMLRHFRELENSDQETETFYSQFINHIISFRSEEHTSELQSRENLVCRLLL